jgi:ethanolamine utilization protein EutQ (cupin superfamily)
MTAVTVLNLRFDKQFAGTVGPMEVDRRSRASALTEISTGFSEFVEEGSYGPETMPYEETLYVLAGELTVTQGDCEIVGRPGDLLSLEKGSTVTVTGTRGTRLLYTVSLLNWEEPPDQ